MAGNCALVYYDGRTAHGFTCWASGYWHDYILVASESGSRRQRAFYPHRIAPGQFAVTLALRANTRIDGNDRPITMSSEYDRWGKFMADYYNFLLQIGAGHASATVGKSSGVMMVTMKGRGWTRFGIPVQGASFGDHFASMLYSPTLVFESSNDPTDPASNFAYSYYNDTIAIQNDRVNEPFFYPFGEYAQGDKDSALYDYTQMVDYRLNDGDVASQVDLARGGRTIPPPQNDNTLNTHTQDDLQNQYYASGSSDATTSGTTATTYGN